MDQLDPLGQPDSPDHAVHRVQQDPQGLLDRKDLLEQLEHPVLSPQLLDPWVLLELQGLREIRAPQDLQVRPVHSQPQ